MAGFLFFPLDNVELRRVKEGGINPQHLQYCCGACGQHTTGRVLAVGNRSIDNATIHFAVCSCPQAEPTVLIYESDTMVKQLPVVQEFQPGKNWPPDLEKLFSEAAKAYAVGAPTAAAMVARKVLMVCACHHKAPEGKKFVEYVNYITDKILTFAKAKDAIDKIREIGNDANHEVAFVSLDDARRSLQIVAYMLNTIYSLPSA